jgi:hypothetical protein
MLVCSVVLRPQAHKVAAAIAEAAIAFDDASIGAIYATLTDDPGNARDILVAIVGQIVAEAANAADVVNAGALHNAAIVEETNALASVRLPGPVAAALAEAANASLTQDATATGPLVPVTRPLSASRAGSTSTVINDDGSGKTKIV